MFIVNLINLNVFWSPHPQYVLGCVSWHCRGRVCLHEAVLVWLRCSICCFVL